MNAPPRERFERWAYAAFALAAVTAALFLFLGSRPGGAPAVLAYRFGLLVLGWGAAVGMLFAVVWSLRRRPVLQRKRVWPLTALGATLWFCSLPIAYPSSHEGKFSTTRFALPFEGTARVRWGGESPRSNPLLFDPARRFGVAFEADQALAARAPASGTVVARTSGRGGDEIVLATAAGEFCVVAGIAPDGGPRPGAEVRQGEPIGSAPALLLVHLQDRPEPGHGEGIPMRFFGYSVGGRIADAGVPVPKQEVASAIAPASASGRAASD